MRVFPFALALLLAGCATYPTVQTDFDPAADFANYRSYSWAPLKVPAGMNPLLFRRVQASIDRSLAARGYQQSAASDFIIDFTVVEKDRAQIYDDYWPHYGGGWGGWGWGPGWGPGYPSIDIDYYTQRSIVIDIYDGSDRRAVWHGTVKKNGDQDRIDYAKLDGAVDAVLSRFPPSAGPQK